MSTATKKAPKSKAPTKKAAASKTATKSKTSTVKKPASPSVSTKASKPAPATVPKSVPTATKPVTPTVVTAPEAVVSGPVLRKKELVDAIVARTGRKKKDVKPVVEDMLSVLGEALSENRDLNLPPFGRLKVRRQKDLARGRVVVAKIRQQPKSDGES